MRALVSGFLLLALLAPKPKPAGNVHITQSLCPATGSCRVILSWTRPGNYTAATDTAHTLWLAAPDTLKKGTPLGAADTLLAPRPADGQTASGTVRLCYTRKGWSGQACNAPVAWSVTAPVSPVDTAMALKLAGLIVKPDSYRVTLATWDSLGLAHDATGKLVDVRTGSAVDCPAAGAKCPQKRFCVFTVASDSSIGMTVNSFDIPECQRIFTGLPGHLSTFAPTSLSLLPGWGQPQIRVTQGPEWATVELLGWTRGTDGVWRVLPSGLRGPAI